MGRPGEPPQLPRASKRNRGSERLRRSACRRSFCLLALIAYPLLVPSFFTFRSARYSLILGMIALSLMVLAGYGGMLSLAQMTIAGIAAYTVAIFGHNSDGVMGLGWPWWIAAPFAIALAAVSAALIGLIAVRTDGIYTIMITLAIVDRLLLFRPAELCPVQWLSGYRGIEPPTVFGHHTGAIQSRSTICALAAGAAAYGAVHLRFALGLRPGAAGDPRQPASHAGARLQRHAAQGLRLVRLRE